jgi:hypothetical protein
MTEVFKILSNGTYQLGGSPTTVDDAVYVRISNMSTGGNYIVETRETSGGSAIGRFRIAPLESLIFKKEPSHYVYGNSGNLYCASVAPNP